MLEFFSSRMISPYIFRSAKNFNLSITLAYIQSSFVCIFAIVTLTGFKAVCNKTMTCIDLKQKNPNLHSKASLKFTEHVFFII